MLFEPNKVFGDEAYSSVFVSTKPIGLQKSEPLFLNLMCLGNFNVPIHWLVPTALLFLPLNSGLDFNLII